VRQQGFISDALDLKAAARDEHLHIMTYPMTQLMQSLAGFGPNIHDLAFPGIGSVATRAGRTYPLHRELHPLLARIALQPGHGGLAAGTP